MFCVVKVSRVEIQEMDRTAEHLASVLLGYVKPHLSTPCLSYFNVLFCTYIMPHTLASNPYSVGDMTPFFGVYGVFCLAVFSLTG